MGLPITLLWVDEHVVVADKPSGLLVHRGWDDDDDVAMFRVRDAIGEHVHPLHRLDRGTSGALVFALDPDSQRVLSQDFEAQRVQKRYLTLVRGRLTEGGTLDYAIPKSEKGERVPAVTEYRPLLVLDRFTLVEAVPKTGRLRQIRRHMKHLGHPIVLDKRHGRGEFHGLAAERYGFTRMVLHSREVGFDQKLAVSFHALAEHVGLLVLHLRVVGHQLVQRAVVAALGGVATAAPPEVDAGDLLHRGDGEHRRADRVIRRWDAVAGRPLSTTIPEVATSSTTSSAATERGAVVFRACQACHTVKAADGPRAGPTLAGIMGRRIGTAPGYAFSDALSRLDIVWTRETIARLFEVGPAAYTPGTKMPEQTITDPADRQALVDWLASVTR